MEQSNLLIVMEHAGVDLAAHALASSASAQLPEPEVWSVLVQVGRRFPVSFSLPAPSQRSLAFCTFSLHISFCLACIFLSVSSP